MALLTAPQGGQTGGLAYPQTWLRLLGLPPVRGSVGSLLPLHPICSTSSGHVGKAVAGNAAGSCTVRLVLIPTEGMANTLLLATMC